MRRVSRSSHDWTLARRRRRPAADIGCRSPQNMATVSRTGSPVMTLPVSGPVTVVQPVTQVTGPMTDEPVWQLVMTAILEQVPTQTAMRVCQSEGM